MSFTEDAGPRDREFAHVIRSSSAFEADFYLLHAADEAAHADPALHYVMVGEPAGRRASPRFHGEVYAALNPDLESVAVNKLWHYEMHGRAEGRRHVYESEGVGLDDARLDPGKPTVLLLLHEASYSGAPILGWNLARELKLTRNVVVVVPKGGGLLPALQATATAVVGPMEPGIITTPGEVARLAERLVELYRPAYVIANSIETRLLAQALRQRGAPYIALVHEFATHAPPHALKPFYQRCAGIVFPSDVVRESSVKSYGLVEQRKTHILPQGASEVPRFGSAGPDRRPEGFTLETGVDADDGAELPDLLASSGEHFIVAGLGPIDLRKGVDLFVSAAAAVRRQWPHLAIRFVWIGERVHDEHHQYNVFLREQVERSGLRDHVSFFAPVDDLKPVYAAAKVLFISSRLDPLPNVGIDAAVRGIPLVCFDNATGFAELLKRNCATASLVVPHLDAGAAAETIASLALDPVHYAAASTAVARMARRTFDMTRYADQLDALGLAAAGRLHEVEAESAALLTQDAFDPAMYFGPLRKPFATREAAARAYLDESREIDFSGPAVWGDHPRRPLAGFHPLAYGKIAGRQAGPASPLVDFLRKGRPAGPWLHDVLRIEETLRPAATHMKVAVHGHFHYVDNIEEFMSAMAANTSSMDLFLTTTSAEAARSLERATSKYAKGKVSITLGDNSGRDVKPFIDILGLLQGYDVVGHFHGKRSLHTYSYDAELGNRWRTFLWQHLVGPAAPVADIVLQRFEADPTLGLVFPENDSLVGWEKNLQIARAIAPRLGLGDLPEHIEFPVGTMFWARPAALRALGLAGFSAAEYPAEPLPIDGTMLHALERLFPLVVGAAGYHYATTYFPRFTR